MGRQEFLKVLEKASDKEWLYISRFLPILLEEHRHYLVMLFEYPPYNDFPELTITKRLLRALEKKEGD